MELFVVHLTVRQVFYSVTASLLCFLPRLLCRRKLLMARRFRLLCAALIVVSKMSVSLCSAVFNFYSTKDDILAKSVVLSYLKFLIQIKPI